MDARLTSGVTTMPYHPPPGITDTIWQHGKKDSPDSKQRTLDSAERESEITRRKKEEHMRMLEERRALIQQIRGREEDNNSFWPIHLQTKSPPEISPPPNVLKQEVTSVYHNVLKLNGKTARELWRPPLIPYDEWSRKEDQIKKDEQFARALQEQYDHASCTPPETSKSRDVGDHQDSPDSMQTLDSEESESEEKRRKKNEHMQMLRKRRKLIEYQFRKIQEENDRKLAQELAIRDMQQAGLVPLPVYREAVQAHGPLL